MNCFIKIIQLTNLVSQKSCCVIFYPPVLYIYHNFNDTYYRLGKRVHKRQNMVRFLQKQIRVSQNHFKFPFFYTNIDLTTWCTFFLVSLCFFILYHYFQKERIVWVWSWFYYFSPIELRMGRYVRGAILLLLLLYFSSLNKAFIRKSQRVLFL